MLPIVIGLTYGSIVGFVGNWWLFRALKKARSRGEEPLRSLAGVFFFRYLFDFVALLLHWFIFKNKIGLVVVGISITVAVKISLLMVYRQKGGRF